MIDSVCDETGFLLGRSYAEAPEIDSSIRMPSGSGQVGELVRCRITGTDDYDLVAELIENEKEGKSEPGITVEGKRLA